MPLLALLVLCGAAPVLAQGNKPVLHTNILQPSSTPPGSLPLHGSSIVTVHTNGNPVNTGTGMVYTCDASVAAATCTYLNTTVAGYYNDTFTNMNANIYVKYGSTGLGQSQYYFNFVTYSQYATAYSSMTGKSAIQTSAQSALAAHDATPYGSDFVWIQPSLAAALGLSAQVQGGGVGTGLGPQGITTALANCNIGSAGCYNGIITVSNDAGITLYYDNLGGTEPAGAYDYYAVVEHETDEVVGTSSCVSTQSSSLSDSCDSPATASAGTGTPSTVDLFRYSGAGTLVLDSSLSTAAGAYFSYDGGTTNGANGKGGTPKVYNTLSNGDDYADFVASSPDCGTDQAIQDATGCPGEDAGVTILNDGGAEVNILTAMGYGVPASSSFCTTPNPNPNPNPAVFAEPADFTNNCKSDLLWQNSSTGELYLWLMNGTSESSAGSAGTVNPTSGWTLVGAGDFNGDGMSDLLWRNMTPGGDGQLYIWLMNGTAPTSEASPGSVAIALGWNIAGIGDFNGDGKSDILWRNSSTGEVYLWLMNGTSSASQASLGVVDSTWVIKGIGDFNGDGKADILWQNSSTGELYLWLMNGTSIASQASPGTVASSTSWGIAGVGDFDGDGKSDILWQNSSSGELYLWLMNGTSAASEGSAGTVPPATNWVIEAVGSANGTGDFNGDGKADILWRNTSSGDVYIWLMNGTASLSQASPGSAATVWVTKP